MNPATISDVERRFRPLTTDLEKTNAAAWLEDVWVEACARAPGVQARMDTGVLSSALVVRVVAGATARLLRNPERLREWSGDDVRYSPETGPGGGMHLTVDEVALLAGPVVDGFTGSWAYT